MTATTTSAPSSFGEALFRRRKAAGLTQTRLAEITGISRVQICKLENGHVRQPKAVYLYALRTSLGVSEDEDDGLWVAAW